MTNKFERQVKGLLGTKLGMTQVWDEDGKFVPVTVVKADSNVVTQIRNQETDGYTAVQIGFGCHRFSQGHQAAGWSLRESRCYPSSSPR